MPPELRVSIQIHPRPSEISKEELNGLFADEVRQFEKWFMESQRKAGIFTPTPLISAEEAILRSYMMFLHTKENP